VASEYDWHLQSQTFRVQDSVVPSTYTELAKYLSKNSFNISLTTNATSDVVGLKSRRSKKLQFFVRHYEFPTEFRQFQFSEEKITGAHHFDIVFKFPSKWGFNPTFCMLKRNFRTKKFSDDFSTANFWGREGGLSFYPPPPRRTERGHSHACTLYKLFLTETL